MPIDDFTYLMKRGYTSQQLEKMVNDGVNIKALRIEESNKESKENLALLTGKTDNLAFLMENGMSLEEIKHFQKDGIPLEEVAASVKRMVDRGEALTGGDHHEQTEDKPKLSELDHRKFSRRAFTEHFVGTCIHVGNLLRCRVICKDI